MQCPPFQFKPDHIIIKPVNAPTQARIPLDAIGRIAQLGERQTKGLKVSGSILHPANVCDHRELDPAMEAHMRKMIHRRT